ncbi:MAG: glutathione synthase [Rhodocyclaceae bacterium]
MRFAFVLDPLERLKAAKDTSVAMMRELQGRGHALWAIRREDLSWHEGVAEARATEVRLTAGDTQWFAAGARARRPLAEFDAVLMRQDPPFDLEYLAATWLLERAEANGALVFNRPRAIRDHSEKLAICEFPEFTVPTLVASAPEPLHAFIEGHGDTVLKPLEGMGGSSVFRVRAGDPNRNVIVEVLTDHGRRTIMAQRFIPEVSLGDKRILLIAGEVVPYALARIPKPGETRANLAAGGTGVAQALCARDREIAEALAPVLASRGLLLVGLDVIGGWLTEINVTSPTCFVEIASQTGFDVAGMFADALERAVRMKG